MANTSEPLQTAAFLGKLWNNRSARRVQQYASEGVITKAGRGKYPLLTATSEFIAYQDKLLDGDDESIDFRKERARKERAQADKTEFDLAVARREYVHVSHVERVLERASSAAAARFDAITSRLKNRYPDLTEKQIAGIKKEIAEARNFVAQIDPAA